MASAPTATGDSIRRAYLQGGMRRSGFLTKKGGTSLGFSAFQSWQRRWFYLAGPTLRYYTERPALDAEKEDDAAAVFAAIGVAPCNNAKGTWSLDGAVVTVPTGEARADAEAKVKGSPSAFSFVLTTADQTSFHLFADDADDLRGWVEALGGVLAVLRGDLSDPASAGGVALGATQPVLGAHHVVGFDGPPEDVDPPVLGPSIDAVMDTVISEAPAEGSGEKDGAGDDGYGALAETSAASDHASEGKAQPAGSPVEPTEKVVQTHEPAGVAVAAGQTTQEDGAAGGGGAGAGVGAAAAAEAAVQEAAAPTLSKKLSKQELKAAKAAAAKTAKAAAKAAKAAEAKAKAKAKAEAKAAEAAAKARAKAEAKAAKAGAVNEGRKCAGCGAEYSAEEMVGLKFCEDCGAPF